MIDDYTMGFPGAMPVATRRLPAPVRNEGMHPCMSCPRLILAEQRSCHGCLRLEAEYDARRKSEQRRATFRRQPGRVEVSVVEYPPFSLEDDEPQYGQAWIGVAIGMARFVGLLGACLLGIMWALWHAIHDLVQLGIWFSGQ